MRQMVSVGSMSISVWFPVRSLTLTSMVGPNWALVPGSGWEGTNDKGGREGGLRGSDGDEQEMSAVTMCEIKRSCA